MYVESKTPEIRRILDAAQHVAGKRNADVSVGEFIGPRRVNSYWDGGSRNDYALVELGTLKVWNVPTTHPYFDRLPNGDRCGELELQELPPNTCLVQGGYFCGKPAHINLYFRPENLVGLLPAPPAPLSDGAQSALRIIRSNRGGFRLGEFVRAKLGHYGPDNPAVRELAAAGLISINKAGSVALTTAGRNYGR